MEEQLKLQFHLRSLLAGLLYYYPDLKIEGITPEKHPDFDKKSLVEYALKLTQAKNIKEAIETIGNWLAHDLELTTLPPDQLKQLQGYAEERARRAEESRKTAQKRVQEVVSQPQPTPPETPPTPEPEEVVYYEPAKTYVPPPPPPEAREKVIRVREEVEKRGEAYAQGLTTEFSPRVAIESLPPGITAEVMTRKAVTGALDLITNFDPVKGAAVVLFASPEEARLTKHIVAAIANQEVAEYLLPNQETAQTVRFKDVPTPRGNTYAYSQTEGVRYIPPLPRTLGGPVLEAAAYAAEKAGQREQSLAMFLYSKGFDASNLALLGLSKEQERRLRIILDKYILYAGCVSKPTLLEAEIRRAGIPQQVSSFLSGETGLPRQGLFKRVFQQLFGKASATLVNTALKRGAQKLGQKLLEKGALAAAGAAAGPVGIAIVSAIGFIKDKVLLQLIRLLRDPERRKEAAIFMAALALGLIGAGVMLGATPLIILSVPLFALSFATLGPAQAIRLGAARVGTALIGFTGFALKAIALPLVITLISIPIAIALIIFIINSGAYVVPPGGRFLTGARLGPGGVYPMCWPMYGKITQLPWYYPLGSGFSHNTITEDGVLVHLDAFDIATPAGAEVYATHDGRAVPIDGTEGYGKFVVVTSPEGFQTVYAHLGTMIATEMDVKAGTFIGTEDDSGTGSHGTHLHYQLRYSSFRLTDAVPQTPRFDDCRELYCSGSNCFCDGVKIYTNGCLAKDQGGGEAPPTEGGEQPPETEKKPSCQSVSGKCVEISQCKAGCIKAGPAEGGWSDCTSPKICCDQTSPGCK